MFHLPCPSLLSFGPCSISDQKDPKERMVQVVKWYLSAFHAGRKGSVAKKPYNPILGEIFRCHWVLPGTEGEDDMVSFLWYVFLVPRMHASSSQSFFNVLTETAPYAVSK